MVNGVLLIGRRACRFDRELQRYTLRAMIVLVGPHVRTFNFRAVVRFATET